MILTPQDASEMILNPLYKVDLIEKDNQHFYTIDGKGTYLPGVTGILGFINKPFLHPWIAKETALYMAKILKQISPRNIQRLDLELFVRRAKLQHKFIKESAARVGTQAHGIFDLVINNGLSNVIAITPFASSFLYWLEKEKLKIICGDTKLASLKYGFGGSMDVGLEDADGKLVIGDFKTGKSIHDSHAYQAGGAYAQAAMETFNLDYFPRAVVIKFFKDAKKYERVEVKEPQLALRAFLAAKEISEIACTIHFENRELVKEKKAKKEKSLI